MKRAQSVMLEFFLAMGVFLMLFLFVHSRMTGAQTEFSGAAADSKSKALLYSVSEVLFRTEGSPYNWNSTNAMEIGLTVGRGYVLDAGKVSSFISMLDDNHTDTLAKLGVPESYQMYFAVDELNGTYYMQSNQSVGVTEKDVYVAAHNCYLSGVKKCVIRLAKV